MAPCAMPALGSPRAILLAALVTAVIVGAFAPDWPRPIVTKFQETPPSPPSIPYRMPLGEKARPVIVGATPGPPSSVPIVVGEPLAGLIVHKAPLHGWVGLHGARAWPLAAT